MWARTVSRIRIRPRTFPRLDFLTFHKAGKGREPVVEDGYHFRVKLGTPKNAAAAKAGTKLSRGSIFSA